MKILLYSSILFTLLSCDNTSEKETETLTNYVSISGKITNLKEGDLVITDGDFGFSKTIIVKEDGTFKDTLIINDSITNYSFSYGEESSKLFLRNGYDLSLTLNTNEFDETLKYKGKGAKENNFLIQKFLSNEDVDFMSLISPKNENFEADVKVEAQKMTDFLMAHKNLDSLLVNHEKEIIQGFRDQAKYYHSEAIEEAKALSSLIGKPSPNFLNYETPKGELVSLDQFKGKYTYIDIWATWCGPCKAEIPAIKEFLSTKSAQKINVISISVDEEEATETWKNMIIEEELTWNQLKADSAWNSSFIKGFSINSIPRFILLDPKGNVVNPNAPRPSSEDFKTMIENLEL